MQLNFSQQMKMSQQMKLAPRMIQSMEILQLPLMALQERIEQELAENAVLERSTDEADDGDDAGGENGAASNGEDAPRGEVELPDALSTLLSHGFRLRAVPVRGPWVDVGTPEDLARARRLFGGEEVRR